MLQAGALGVAGLSLPTLMRAEASGTSSRSSRPRAKSIIYLNQFGGPSHHDTFDMKPDTPENIRGEFRPTASSVPGMFVSEHLPRMAQVMHHACVIRSMHHRMRNHNSATYYSLTGVSPPLDDIRLRDTLDLYPAFGSTVSRLRPADGNMPSFIAYPHILRDGSVTPGQHASFLGKNFDPLFFRDDPNAAGFRLPELTLPGTMSLERLDDRRDLLRLIDAQADAMETSATARGIDTFYQRAFGMLASARLRRAFNLSEEPDRIRDQYGRTTYGQSCLLARRLVEAGVRFVNVYFSQSIGGGNVGGWDTHGDNFNRLRNRLLPMTDQTVPTLISDLAQRGLLDETLVVWMGEFGRTPRVTNSERFGPDGRDHWPQCYSAVLFGGGVRGGIHYGSSDRIGAYPATNPVRPDDIAATMYHALGIDPATEVRDPLGRPLPVSNGAAVTEIFG